MAEDSGMTTLVVTYLNAVNQLQQKCSAFKDIRDDDSKSKLERAEAGLAALDISEDIARLQASFNDMKANFAPGFTPPSSALVNQAVTLAAQVGSVLKAEKNTQALLQAVTSFVNDFTAVITGTPPTAAGATGTASAATSGAASGGAGSAQKLTNLQWFTAHQQPSQPPGTR